MKQEIAAFVPIISGFLSVLFFCVVIRLCKAFSERNVWHMRFVWMVLLLCVVGFLPASVWSVRAEERIIDIVYDNSGSMAFNDTEELDRADNYITRWVEADYAVRALSALMEEEDRLYLFPMDKNREAAQPQENVHYYEISGPDDKDIDRASESFGNTYYAGVENTLAHLKNYEGERWIIILTDSENKDIWERTLNQVLRGITDIGILYVPIAESPETLNLDSSIAGKVIQVEPDKSGSSQRGSIFTQILEATDSIYRRNSLTLGENGEIRVDAPVKELIVLMQSEGDTVSFQNRQTGSENQNLKSQVAVLEQEIGSQTGLVTRRRKSFQSYSSETEPSYGGNLDFAENLQIKEIQGEMVAFGGKSTIHEGSIYQKTLTVRANESVNIYYQLDLGVELEVKQDGKLVEENELLEGDCEVTVYPVNPDSGERVSTDAQLLQELSVSVNGRSCQFGETIFLNVVYPDEVKLAVQVEGAALQEPIELTRGFKVRERIYPLAVQVLGVPDFLNYDKMNLDSIKNGEASGIRIKLSENMGSKRIALRDSTADKLEITCMVDYKGRKRSEESHISVEIAKVDGTTDEFMLYPYLTSAQDFDTYRDVRCSVVVWRTDGEEQSRAEQEIAIDLRAVEARLEAELVDGRRYSRSEVIHGGVAYLITCDGEELPESELEKLSFHTLAGGCPYVNLSKAKGTFQFIKKLGLSIYWLYNGKETIPIHSEITYTRRGVPCTAVLKGEIQVILAPLALRICLYIVTALVVLFLLYLIFNLLTRRCFSPFFFCVLYFNNDSELGIRLSPSVFQSFRQMVLPAKGMTLQLSEAQREMYGIECPELQLQKRRKGGRYYLMNWAAFSRKDAFRINGKYIFRGNAAMTKADRFEFMDSAGLWNTIVFRGNQITGEDEKR